MGNIHGAQISSEDGLVIVARGTMIGKKVTIRVRGNAVVASYSELVDKIHRLEKYVQTTGAEIYDNFGTRHSFEELVQKKVAWGK